MVSPTSTAPTRTSTTASPATAATSDTLDYLDKVTLPAIRAERLADTLAGVAAVVMIFAVTLAGPRVHAGARTEVGRTVAVVLQSVGFGGVLGALLILT